MHVVTITGIRPDFIRMSAVFERLDARCRHTMIHTGQHYDDELSRIFFRELSIREPDFTLETGRRSRTPYEQLGYLSTALIELLREERLEPDIILFLGDSHSVLAAVPLFKEGYRIGHIEGGMRSYDRRMPEETNRVCCDYCSDLVFVYTPLYKERLIAENKPADAVHVVGNTIVEVVARHRPTGPRSRDYLVADIHRNENLRDARQYGHMLDYLEELGRAMDLEVRLVRFPRAARLIEEHGLLAGRDRISLVGPYGFLEYLDLQYQARAVVSDSGTSQEECPLLGVPVAVPRDFTERPESVEHGNSILVGEDRPVAAMVDASLRFFSDYSISDEQRAWLGDGRTSETIVSILEEEISA